MDRPLGGPTMSPVRGFRFPMQSLVQAAVAVLLLLASSPMTSAAPISVVVYNVENLFDIDGRTVFEDYRLGEGDTRYSPRKLLTKIQNISRVMALVDESRGPDIILFQEIEADNTPASGMGDEESFLKRNAGRTVKQLLSGDPPEETLGWPAEAWLLKAMAEAGLKGYRISGGGRRADPTGRPIAHTNLTFSRLPIVETRIHPAPGARPILETRVRTANGDLYLFNNHWKSGASDPESELIRIGNAEVLRERIDEILAGDPSADLLIGGDLNSHYNQGERNPAFRRTAIGQVLRAQASRAAVSSTAGEALYNLWHELPQRERASDHFRGEWGTLMHIIISRGLLDHSGLQYVDGSFRVLKVPGLNADAVSGLPIRWSSSGLSGSGFSDHFPLAMRIQGVDTDDAGRFLPAPERAEGPGKVARSVALDVDLSKAVRAAAVPPGEPLQVESNRGVLYLVEGRVVDTQPFIIEVRGERFRIHSPDRELRDEIHAAYVVGEPIRLYGRLRPFRTTWQFVVEDRSWWPR